MWFVLHLDDDICLVGFNLPADLLDEVVGGGAGGDCDPRCALGAALVDQTDENSHKQLIIMSATSFIAE